MLQDLEGLLSPTGPCKKNPRLIKSEARATKSHEGTHKKSYFLFVTLFASRSVPRITPLYQIYFCFSFFKFSLSVTLAPSFCLSCSAAAISSWWMGGIRTRSVSRLFFANSGVAGTQIFNTHRLYSMSAMFPRWCRAFLYALSASAILPWFFSTFPKFPQATGDKCQSKVALSEGRKHIQRLCYHCQVSKKKTGTS